MKNIYCIYYRVKYVDEMTNDYKTCSNDGIVAATGFGDAVKRLQNYYGKDNIISYTFEELDADDGGVMDFEWFDDFFKEKLHNLKKDEEKDET